MLKKEKKLADSKIFDFIRNKSNQDQIMFILNQTSDEITMFVILEFLNKIVNSDSINDYFSIKQGTIFNLDKLLRCVDLFNKLSLEDDLMS